MRPGKPIHPSNGTGTAPDAAATPGGTEISFDGGVNRVRQGVGMVVVSNVTAAGGNFLQISFSDGKLWFDVAPATTILMPISCHRCYVRGRTGAVALYSILGILI
jgi:hypothetical protein